MKIDQNLVRRCKIFSKTYKPHENGCYTNCIQCPLNPINYPSKYFVCSVHGLELLTGIKDTKLLDNVSDKCVSVFNFIASISEEELE